MLAVAVAAVGFSRLGDGNPIRETRPVVPSTRPVTRAPSIEALLHRQSDTVAASDRSGYLAVWGRDGATREQAVRTYDNLARLGVSELSPRLALATVRERGAIWTAQVYVSWRLGGQHAATAVSALRYRFTRSPVGLRIADIQPVQGDRTPVWLLPRLEVRRGARTVVAGVSAAAVQRVDRLLRQAASAVARVLPRWRGGLVAYVPASQRQFAALLAAAPGQYREIAAVTTTVDGSRTSAAPQAIVVNPSVFAGLGPVGAHVVITHEATHAATGAAAVSMPLWVAEGFADYVAIGSEHVPVGIAAKAALTRVRDVGAPRTLPDDAAFAVDGAHLEAVYEQAWLAARLIGRDYGRQRLVAFYHAVAAHPDEGEAAFRSILGTTAAAFTASWRGYLLETAGGG